MAFNGRKIIMTNHEYIDSSNVVDVLNNALAEHAYNVHEIKYLDEYVRGKQPIDRREKLRQSDICNKIKVNRAAEIVEFKTAYLLGEPCQYISRTDKASEIGRLNDYMTIRDKAAGDEDLAYWFYVCGVAYRMVKPTIGDEAPFNLFVLEPERTFVVYSSDVEKKPLMGVYEVQKEDNSVHYYVYTDKMVYVICGNDIVNAKPHILGSVPIIEYRANDTRMGCFEPVLDLLNAVNLVESDRVDGVEQFVQAYFKFQNCNIDEAQFNEFKKKGLIVYSSEREAPADVGIITLELNQTQVQTLVDDLNRKIDTIAGMPSQSDGNTSDSSNNGAVILRNGWQAAEARAKRSEFEFRKSEKRMLAIVLKMCRDNSLFDISLSDIDMAFTRRNYTDISTKAQVLNLMLGNDRIDPKDAFAACGMFSDPNAAYERGNEHYETVKSENINNGTKEPVPVI